MKQQIIHRIHYVKINNQCGEAYKLKDETMLEFGTYVDNLYKVQNSGKSLFSHIECESKTENSFAGDLDTRESVRLFLKLPRWFRINTPLGTYSPDWAFVNHNHNTLYFIAETKGSTNEEDLRRKEAMNIVCGRKHFESLGIKFEACPTLSDYLMKVNSRSEAYKYIDSPFNRVGC